METTNEIDFLSILVPLLIVVFIIAIGVFLLNQHFQRNLFGQRLEQEELKNKHQKELLKSSIAVQETERKRIARDLHDQLGATLAIARMNLVRLEQAPSLEEEVVKASIKNIRSITETALSSMRKISHELMPPLLERFGLVKTIQETIHQIDSGGKLQVVLEAPQELARMSWEVELALYRMCMELLHNTMKHAEAKHVKISFALEDPTAITVSYWDDGQGFDAAFYTPGLGLKSLEARANAMGGTFGLVPGKGFNAQITIPFELIKDDG